MRSLISLAGAALLAIGLVACGGGGGGGAPPSGGTPPAPMTLTVLVNGSTVAADGNGQYAVKAGDTVTITPSQSADWTSTNGDGSLISLLVDSVSSGKWSARLVNEKNTQGSYSVTAKAGTNSALTKTALFKVGAGDARNGSYRVFAGNGTQQTLKLNFDTRSYAMTDAAGQTSSDSFSADAAEAGTWIFRSDKDTTLSKASRFRVSQDVVVGAFPFQVVGFEPMPRVQPFIASRAFVTAQSDLAGTYNRMGIDIAPAIASFNSDARQVEIMAGGSAMRMCDEVTVARIDACSTSLVNYTVTAGTRADSWRYTNVANPIDTGEFSIARVGGQNVYLAAGASSRMPTWQLMRVGLPETSNWPNATARGLDTQINWGSTTLSATDLVLQVVLSDNTQMSVTYGLFDLWTQGPRGMRLLSYGGQDVGLVAQGAGLAVVVGPASPGYMHLGLLD